MSEAKVSRLVDIQDPALRAFAESMANGMIGAGLKAAASHADPKKYVMPLGDSLERRFLDHLQTRPLDRQQKIAAKSLAVLANKQVPGLEGMDLSGATPVLDIVAAKTKLTKPSAQTGSLGKHVLPTIEDGAPGFLQQDAPDQLQFHLLAVKCLDETDPEIGSDEIALGGVLVDAAGNTISIPQFKVGDFASEGVTKSYDPPIQLGALDFRAGAGWPKTFTMILTFCELDYGKFPAFLEKLYKEAQTAITAAAKKAIGDQTIGEVVGAGVAWLLDKVLGWLKTWWEDDVFKPVSMTFDFASADARFTLGQSETGPIWIDCRGDGGRYRLWYKAKLALAAESAQAAGAIVYENTAFGGRAVTLPVGHYTVGQLQARGVTNDTLSSMKVGAGLRVIAYQHDGFQGDMRVFSGSTPDLGMLNDKISSLVIEPVYVMLFKDASYGGESQAFGRGRYDVAQLKIGNDQASSVMVPPGYKVTLFQNAGFQGTKKVLTADTAYVGADFNDVVSSLVVELA